MARRLSIACLQTCPKATIGEAIDEALPIAEEAVEAGADILFLPEYCSGLVSEEGVLKPPAAPEADHPMVSLFQQFARRTKVCVSLGSVAVSSASDKIINRAIMINTDGKVISRYDKIHLFDVQISPTEIYRESATVIAGDNASIINFDDFKLAHVICYDLRFPQLFRDLAQAGAEVIAVPAAFMKKTGEVHWHVLNRARAIENGCFIVAPCAVGGIPGGGESYGHSLIVNPWGEVLADGKAERGFIQAHIDLDEVKDVRAKIPSLSHDQYYKVTS